jgi:hypothetical protein
MLEGLDPFLENAAIYRGVTKRNGVLTFEDAVRFIKNQYFVERMALARALEAKLSEYAVTAVSATESARANDGFARLSAAQQSQVTQFLETVSSDGDVSALHDKILGWAIDVARPEAKSDLADYLAAVKLLRIESEMKALAYGVAGTEPH